MIENCNDNNNSTLDSTPIPYKRTVFTLPTEFPVYQIYLESYKEGRLRLGLTSSAWGGQPFDIDRENVYWTIKNKLPLVFEILYPVIVDSLYVTNHFQKYLERINYEFFAGLIEDIIDYKMCDPRGKVVDQDNPVVMANIKRRNEAGGKQGLFQRLCNHAKQPHVIEAYLNYFRQKHDYYPPEILQAYGILQGITFHFWQKNPNGSIQPHKDFSLQAPSRNQPNINLVYEGNKCTQLNNTDSNENLFNNTSLLIGLLRDIDGFKLQNHTIYFDFDFRFIFEIENIISTIFFRLQKINIAMKIGLRFIRYLYEFHDDFLRGFPDNSPPFTTEIADYCYKKQAIACKKTVWQPNNSDSKLGSVILSIKEHGSLDLTIYAKTVLHYGFIRDALQSIQWHKHDTNYSDYYGYISYYFNVREIHSKEKIEQSFQQIFERLIRDLKVPNTVKRDFLKELEEYFSLNETSLNNTEPPDQKLFPFYRTEYYLSGGKEKDSCKNIRPTSEQMYLAAFNATPNSLLKFLRQGLSPNFVYDDNSLLEALITHGPDYAKSSEDVLDSMKILIDYGVDPNQKTLEGSYQKMLVTWLAQNSYEACLARSANKNSVRYNHKKWKLRLEMLAMLMCIPGFEVDITDMHRDFMHTAYAQIIEQANYLIRIKPVEYSINNIVVKANARIMFETTDNNQIELEVRYSSLKLPLKIASKDEVKILLGLFKQAFPWVEENHLHKLLAYALTVKTGTLYLDIIRSKNHNHRIVGFNISEVVSTNPDGSPILIDGKPAVIHHLRLSVCTLGYKHLMHIVQYQRGFALTCREKRLKSNRPVVTTMDLVSFYGLMQLKKFVSYPRFKSLEELISVINEAVYEGEIFKAENDFFYFDDEGLAKALGKPISFIKALKTCYVDSYVGYANKISNLQNKASKDFYEKFFLGNGSSGSIMGVFCNNPTAFFAFVKTTSEAMANKDFPLDKIYQDMESVLEPVNNSTKMARY